MADLASTLSGVKALTFDTGGTILDWHTGLKSAWATAGTKHGVEQDWGAVANATRRNAIKRMVNLGEHEPPTHNFDDAHRMAVDQIASEYGLVAMSTEERKAIWWDAVHSWKCWEDFPPVLPKLREKYIVASFTSERQPCDRASASTQSHLALGASHPYAMPCTHCEMRAALAISLLSCHGPCVTHQRSSHQRLRQSA
jgi:hypothetical protein